jgi:pimeloyl-ACP methyl ester carboxylesterase
VSAVTETIEGHAGTPIHLVRQGSGPTVVIVHGIQATAAAWAGVADLLAATHHCVVLNRRGRAPSGPTGADYDTQVEVADLHAVLDHVGPDVTVVGHSYGGTIALLAAVEREDIRSLVLYEAALPLGGPLSGAALEPMAAAIQRGDLDEALAVTMTQIMGMPPEAVEQLRGTPQWQAQRGLTAATYAELRALDRVASTVEPFGKLTMPVTILLGEQSGQNRFVAVGEALADAIPGTRLVRLPSQHHLAHLYAPGLLVDEIIAAARRAG